MSPPPSKPVVYWAKWPGQHPQLVTALTVADVPVLLGRLCTTYRAAPEWLILRAEDTRADVSFRFP